MRARSPGRPALSGAGQACAFPRRAQPEAEEGDRVAPEGSPEPPPRARRALSFLPWRLGLVPQGRAGSCVPEEPGLTQGPGRFGH